MATGARQWSAGGGTLAGEPLGPGQEWSADLTYNEDGTVTGQVTVTGSQNVATASFTGTVSGNRVTGALRDAQGNELATIDGGHDAQSLFRQDTDHGRTLVGVGVEDGHLLGALVDVLDDPSHRRGSGKVRVPFLLQRPVLSGR